MSSPESATDRNAKGQSPAWRSFRNVLIVVFASCHAVKLLAAIIPESARPDPLPFGVAHAYEALTGTRQDWGMFTTIPVDHHYQTQVVITDAHGKERQVGPMLPPHQMYPEPQNARVYLMFSKMFGDDPTVNDLRDGYLHRVETALRDEQRIKPGEKWSFEVTEDLTRHLVHIRRDGKLFQRQVRRYSPAAQDDPLPYPVTE